MTDDGFYNHRTGKYVSSERAHQHVGESFGGYEKAISKSSGNFYMRAASAGVSDLMSPVLEAHATMLYSMALQSYCDAIRKTTKRMQEKSLDGDIENYFKLSLKGIAALEVSQAAHGDALLEPALAIVPADQREVLSQAENLDGLKENCNLVISLMEKGGRKLEDLEWKMDSVISSDSERESAREKFYALDFIRSSRRDAFRAMRKEKAGEDERNAAIVTFWQTIDAELRVIDEPKWREKAYKEACNLAACGLLARAAEALERIDDSPEATEKLEEVRELITEAENAHAYDHAAALLESGKFEQAARAFADLGDWHDAASQAQAAKDSQLKWQESRYAWARSRMEEQDLAAAADAFESLGAYLDADELARACKDTLKRRQTYRKAEKLESAGDYLRASGVFRSLGEFEDSPSRAKRCISRHEKIQEDRYEEACSLFDAGSLAECASRFEALGEYRDSEDRARKARLLLRENETLAQARKAFSRGRYCEAERLLKQDFLADDARAARILHTIYDVRDAEKGISRCNATLKKFAERIDELEAEISQAEARELPAVESQTLLKEAERRVVELEFKLEHAGLFSFSTKRALRDEISSVRESIQKLRERIPAELEKRDAEAKARLETKRAEILRWQSAATETEAEKQGFQEARGALVASV